MSDKPDPKHGGLVPIGRRGLTTRSSALVRRGLEALASQQPRIVRFPLNRSIGRLFVLNWDPHGDDECEDFGEARGDITVPAGKGLGLLVSVGASTDLSPLTGLKPDDIQELSLSGFQVNNAGLVHLRELTMLRELDLSGTSIGDAGLVYLERLTSLRHLHLSNTEATEAGLATLRKLLPNCNILP